MRSVRSLPASVALTAVLLAAPSSARAANVLLVCDAGADTNLADALTPDGHTVTTVTNDFAAGNAALLGDLSSYDAVFWSANGNGSGDEHTDAAVFTALTSYVSAGGRVFVTGYDSIASPSDPMLIAFIGGSSAYDVPPAPGVVLSIDNALTTGLVDIRGITPIPTSGDRDSVIGPLAGDTVAVLAEDGSGGTQWTLRTVGAGLIAYVSNGDYGSGSSASWTTTSPTDGSHAYNAAARNFAYSAAGATAPCTGSGACTASGRAGICRMGRCCTGCWDGMRCQGGATATACGMGGGSCTDCRDTDPCLSDVCTSGACSHPFAPTTTPCDDGLFCTATDRCDGAGGCAGSGVRCDDLAVCTTDTCDEATDLCTFTRSTGCVIGGACVATGMIHPASPCLTCDPTQDDSDWSPRPVGTTCGAARCSGGSFTGAGTCAASGACTPPPSTRCATGTCASATECTAPCTAGSCPAGTVCAASMRCEALAANGTACTDGSTCTSGTCADGVCCDAACDGVCEACDLGGRAGTCSAIALRSDPDMECPPGLSCSGARSCAPDPGLDAGAPRDGGASSDAGPGADAGAPVFDAGPTIDAGRPPARARGCSCGAAGAPGGGAGIALGLAIAALALARRRG